MDKTFADVKVSCWRPDGGLGGKVVGLCIGVKVVGLNKLCMSTIMSIIGIE